MKHPWLLLTTALAALACQSTPVEVDTSDLNNLTRADHGVVDGEDIARAHYLVAMTLRKINPKVIVQSRIAAIQAGLDIPRKDLEAHYLAGGRVMNVVRAMIAADIASSGRGMPQLSVGRPITAEDVVNSIELLRTKASIHEDLMSSPEDAVDSYRQALDADPTALVTMDALEPFRPEGMASRILGLGDIVGLVDQVRQVVDEKQQQELEEKIKAGDFTLDDFKTQLEQFSKPGLMQKMLGSIGQQAGLLQKLPGMKQLAMARRLRRGKLVSSLRTGARRTRRRKR